MDTKNLRISEPHFDWASLTVQLSPESIIDTLLRKVKGAWRVRAALSHNKGYTQAFEVLDVEDNPLCTVEAGASHGWNLISASGTQPNAEVVEAVRVMAAQEPQRGLLVLIPRLMSWAAISTSSPVWSKSPRHSPRTVLLCALARGMTTVPGVRCMSVLKALLCLSVSMRRA